MYYCDSVSNIAERKPEKHFAMQNTSNTKRVCLCEINCDVVKEVETTNGLY